ncbi:MULTISPECIES: Lrp/AsnC family transcriptional regulator [Pseudomonas syringae group]|uniref:Lrp/AsnC family transcriptional regulator n=1 Tax=Pseudomonas syringae group TaxID=136849 RepID=UPI001C3186B4|nr:MULTISPECIES: Lrp/AsnC family transcriptional regulator [Pseudomonas syringae group]
MIELDTIDRRMLAALEANGRISTVELAEIVNLSPTPCGRRLKRLEEEGVIIGYEAKLNPEALGLGICVIVSVRLSKQSPDASNQFIQAVQQHPEITECLLVTGNIDYMLKVWVRSIEALRIFLSKALQSIPCVEETSTMVVLESAKTTGVLVAAAERHGH